jgi:hypothetical protein
MTFCAIALAEKYKRERQKRIKARTIKTTF